MNNKYNCGDLLSPALQSLVEKKLERLEKKYDLTNAHADVAMSKEGKDYALKMQLVTNDCNIFAKSVSQDMYKNIDECVTKLNSQLSKQKTY